VREEIEDGEGIYRGLERERGTLLVNLRAVGLLFFFFTRIFLYFFTRISRAINGNDFFLIGMYYLFFFFYESACFRIKYPTLKSLLKVLFIYLSDVMIVICFVLI
jgi:hypothetical protein